MARTHKSGARKESGRGIRSKRGSKHGSGAALSGSRPAARAPSPIKALKIEADPCLVDIYDVHVTLENGLYGYIMFSSETKPTRAHPRIRSFVCQMNNLPDGADV